VTVTPLNLKQLGASILRLTERGRLDRDIFWDCKSILEPLLCRLVHAAAALTIVSKPDVGNLRASNQNLAIFNADSSSTSASFSRFFANTYGAFPDVVERAVAAIQSSQFLVQST
jgi:hypothetical protein